MSVAFEPELLPALSLPRFRRTHLCSDTHASPKEPILFLVREVGGVTHRRDKPGNNDAAPPDRIKMGGLDESRGEKSMAEANTKSSFKGVKCAVWGAIIAASLEAHWIWDATVDGDFRR